MFDGYPDPARTNGKRRRYASVYRNLGYRNGCSPGIPGGAVMAALGFVQSILGFNDTMSSLIIALYIAQDSFGTACNVTGDGAIAILVDAISRDKNKA